MKPVKINWSKLNKLIAESLDLQTAIQAEEARLSKEVKAKIGEGMYRSKPDEINRTHLVFVHGARVTGGWSSPKHNRVMVEYFRCTKDTARRGPWSSLALEKFIELYPTKVEIEE